MPPVSRVASPAKRYFALWVANSPWDAYSALATFAGIGLVGAVMWQKSKQEDRERAQYLKLQKEQQ
eukprot:TRINITY_DN14985_c0_g1_i1.p1 TRINITY_DN14985_c0_g1~~TRINITY_DN14985_c0_g1_i1.p1  ORF type:complete len:66 (-),score=17.89 TRINITY_DN14985_c0_g1_i1:125-322(-)